MTDELIVEPVSGAYVMLQPGDATRYEFLVVEHRWEFVVTSVGPLTFSQRFGYYEVDMLDEMAPEVMEASYEKYHDTVCANEWLNSRLFPYAAEKKEINPWTYLAALVACEHYRRAR